MAQTNVPYDLTGNEVIVDDLRLKVATAVSAGSAVTLKITSPSIVNLDTASGSTVTLPASGGTGKRFRLRVTVIPTSNSHIVKVANGTDVMVGSAYLLNTSTSSVLGFATASTSDTVTLNRSTTGGVSVGEWIELEDIAKGFWHVQTYLSNTGTAATPFSATVS